MIEIFVLFLVGIGVGTFGTLQLHKLSAHLYLVYS